MSFLSWVTRMSIAVIRQRVTLLMLNIIFIIIIMVTCPDDIPDVTLSNPLYYCIVICLSLYKYIILTHLLV